MNRTVKKNEWKNFLNDLSRQNKLSLVRLEILSDEFGANEEAKNLPLLGISFEEKGSETGDVLISLGGEGALDSGYLTRTLKDVVAVELGVEANALEIKGGTW